MKKQGGGGGGGGGGGAVGKGENPKIEGRSEKGERPPHHNPQSSQLFRSLTLTPVYKTCSRWSGKTEIIAGGIKYVSFYLWVPNVLLPYETQGQNKYKDFSCPISINVHHKHQGLDPLIRSVSTVTARTNATSVFQLFSFLVVCSAMISKGFDFVAFFASVKASSVCIHLSCLVCL